MSKKVARSRSSPEPVLDFIQKFNRVVTLDKELARKLPAREFELRFDEAGNICIDGKPLGINVNERARALRLRGQDQHTEKAPSDTELAKSAFQVLNDLMGEIHGARIPGYLAIKQPEIFKTKHHRFIVRVSVGAIVLALRKFDDIWTNQIAPILLSDNLPLEGVKLSQELANRKLRNFCNLVVVHYSKNKLSSKTPITKIEELLHRQGFESDEEFFLWTNDAVTKIGAVRDRIAQKYGLPNREGR